MSIARAVLDLVIIAWPLIPDDAFHGDEDELNDFTFQLANGKIDELKSVTTTVSLTLQNCTGIFIC